MKLKLGIIRKPAPRNALGVILPFSRIIEIINNFILVLYNSLTQITEFENKISLFLFKNVIINYAFILLLINTELNYAANYSKIQKHINGLSIVFGVYNILKMSLISGELNQLSTLSYLDLISYFKDKKINEFIIIFTNPKINFPSYERSEELDEPKEESQFKKKKIGEGIISFINKRKTKRYKNKQNYKIHKKSYKKHHNPCRKITKKNRKMCKELSRKQILQNISKKLNIK